MLDRYRGRPEDGPYLVVDRLPAGRRVLVGRHIDQAAGLLFIAHDLVRHDVLLHLADLEQHQVDGIVGNRLQARVHGVLERLELALLQEGLVALVGGFGIVFAEYLLGALRIFVGVRQVVDDELDQLPCAQALDIGARRIEQRAHDLRDRGELRRALRLSSFHLVVEVPALGDGHRVEQLAGFVERFFGDSRRAGQFRGADSDGE